MRNCKQQRVAIWLALWAFIAGSIIIGDGIMLGDGIVIGDACLHVRTALGSSELVTAMQ